MFNLFQSYTYNDQKREKYNDSSMLDDIYIINNDQKRYSFYLKILIILSTILICSFFSIFNFINTSNKTDILRLENGSIWTAPTLVADYNFSVYKSDLQYNAEVQNAKDSVQQIFILDAFAEQNSIEIISSLLQQLSFNMDNLFLLDYVSNDKLQKFNALPYEIKKEEIEKLNKKIIPYIKLIYKRGLINTSLDKITTNNIITVKTSPNQEYYLEKGNLFDRQLLSINTQLFISKLFTESTGEFIAELLHKLIQSNLIYSEELTERSMKYAANSVKKTLAVVHKNEIIIKKGERLDDNKIQRIKSYYVNLEYASQQNYTFIYVVGGIGHVCLVLSFLLLYFIIIRREIWHDNYHLMLIILPVILVCFLGWMSYQYELVNSSIPFEYLIILPACSMFIAIVFDIRVSFYTTVSMAFLLASVRGNDYNIGLIMLFAGMIAAYSVRNIQDRNQLFTSIIFIFIGFLFPIIAIGLERGLDINQIMPQLLFALLNAITSPIILFFAILFLNKFSYYILTDIKLKEYDNENLPILLEMKNKAPGTFEHSRAVSVLAQKCAEVIGIDVLLIKVGALYHDIGKINHAEYFTENKEQFTDKHKFLIPQKSAEIIKKHVLDGIENAIKIKLPKKIIDFIPMHHGTTLIKHFYNVAVNEANEKGVTIQESDFRYPGPKPKTKETAVLMLCDSAEAISKSVSDIQQFSKIFNEVIDDRIADGQFDDSNITLGEIRKVRNVIIDEIKGKLHTRTKYAVIKEKNTLEINFEGKNN